MAAISSIGDQHDNNNIHKNNNTNHSNSNELFLGGTINKEKRFKIYAYLTESFTDEQRIQVSSQIVQDILCHSTATLQSILTSNNKVERRKSMSTGVSVCDGLEDTLIDVFEILCSPLLRITSKNVEVTEDLDDDTLMASQGSSDDAMNPSGSTAMEHKLISNAKSKVLQQLSLQHLVSHILPLVCSLKFQLESLRYATYYDSIIRHFISVY